ncbi:serine/threonine-protein kinase [Actinosynnema sp. NPDC059335]|uniref:serine/threonine-protein kinase n=1 Tax=Actinosynnema sp. NPDC059335 TaxID=3346804 RepID=UPI00366ECF5D
MDAGHLVAGRYRLRARVGAGAMGVVWQAWDERLDRVVALKQLVVPDGVDPVEAIGRAAREARIAARLQHPNAVTVHDVVEEDGRPVLVMEYLPARTLADRIARGPVPAAEAVAVGAQVAGALAAAHAAGIVHRDVKPGNVLLTDDGTAKITDFGIARAVGDVTVTRTGLLAGTPAFLSPEVARGGEPGPASDVFALGATLYAAVEGRPPFGDGDNAIALLHAVAAGRFAPPAQAGPLTGVLLELLRTDPTSRPTMAVVADRLRALATTGPAAAAPSRPTATRLDLHPADTPPPPAPHGTGPHRDFPAGHHAGPHDTASAPHHTGPPAAAPVPHHTGPHGTALAPHPADAYPAPPPTAPPRTALAHPAALTPPPSKRGRVGVIAVAAAAVVGLVLAAIALTADDRSPDATTGSATPPPSSAPPTPSPARLEQAVAEYYALLPRNTAQAWERLGPGLRAQDRRQYDKSWRDVKDLTVSSPPTASGDGTVTVGLDYTGREGRVRESRRLRLVVQDGTPLIDSEEVVSSQRIDEDDDDKGKGHGDKKGDPKRGGGRDGEG